MRGSRWGINRDEYRERATEFARRGESAPKAKLTADKVREIRANRHGKPARLLAEQYGVHVRTIDNIRNYRNWRHV